MWDGEGEQMSFLIYMLKQAEEREAIQHYNYAGAKLRLSQIECRLAEIESQYEPLNGLSPDPDIRKKMLAAAFYVVVGRMPEKESEAKK